MKFQSFAAAAVLAEVVYGQTPAGSQPSTSNRLGVRYNSTEVTPGILLARDSVQVVPTIYSNTTYNGTHMLAFVDLSIAGGRYANSTAPLAVGLETCRTTRLHWLQTGFTQAPNGTFVSSAPPVAEYGGPGPPLNDIPHAYAFYLFRQPSNFSLPAWDAGRDLFNRSAADRVNFSTIAIAQVAGAPVAGNYIRTQNSGNNATGTYDNGTCPASLNGSVTNDLNSTGGGAVAPVPYEGVAGKMEKAVGVVMLAIGVVAFAML